MEDEEWEDVLVCSYLAPPDALGPKAISSSEVEKFLQRKDWAHVVETKKSKPKCVVAKMINKAYQAGKTFVEVGDNMFACRSSLKGYDMMIGWANTVVHVSKNLEARVHPVAPQDNLIERVRFALEQFGHLFLFREGCVAVAYKGNELVKVFQEKYWNLPSHGVCAGKSAIYYIQEDNSTVYKIDKDLNETLVPGTEGTSDFVVLKDERLFWITKSWVVHCGEKSLDLDPSRKGDNKGISTLGQLFSGNMVVSLATSKFCIISPELEIIDSLVNKGNHSSSSYNMRMACRYRNLEVALISFGRGIMGIAVHKLKLHLLPVRSVQHNPDSISFIMGYWLASVNEEYSIIQINI